MKWLFSNFTVQLGAAGKDRVLSNCAISPNCSEWIVMALCQTVHRLL